jgi:hypothetical protein
MNATVTIKAPSWLPDDEDPKNFERFFEDFITKKCRPEDFKSN